MDKLKAEIARKKAEAQALKDKKLQEQKSTQEENDTQNNQLSTSSNVSYIRQKDRILLKQQELEEKQQQLDEERQSKKLKINHNEVTTKNNSTDEKLSPSTSNPDVNKKNSKISFQTFGSQMDATPNAELKAYYLKLPTKEIQNILRKFNLPITLFGETKETRIDRLLQYLSPDQPEKSNNTNSNKTIVTDNSQTTSELTNQTTNTSEDPLPFEEEGTLQEINKKPTGPPYDPTVKFTTMTQLTHEEMIYKYFKTVLKQWNYDLQFKQQQFTSTSSSSMKLPMNLKKELLNQQNCSEFIQPLFGLLKHKQLSHDLIEKLLKMVQYCEDGNFRLANDEYIRTAIGNSAWPIGLTMVGIHERSGRERISTSKVCKLFFRIG